MKPWPFHPWTNRRESYPDSLRTERNGTEQRSNNENTQRNSCRETQQRDTNWGGTVCAKFPRDSTRTAPILYRVTNGSSIVRKHFSFAGRRMNGVMDYRNRSCAPRSRRDMELIEPRVSLSCGFLVNGINTTKRIMRYLATNYSRSQWWIALRARPASHRDTRVVACMDTWLAHWRRLSRNSVSRFPITFPIDGPLVLACSR